MTSLRNEATAQPLYIVVRDDGPHEGYTDIVASTSSETAEAIAADLNHEHRCDYYSVTELPLVADLASARVERLTLRKTAVQSSETRQAEWVFTEGFARVPAEDKSNRFEIFITGHDHEQVRAVFQAAVAAQRIS